jgi:hypothetical protein
MLRVSNRPASRLLSRLTIHTKSFSASAVVLVCLIAMALIAGHGSREVARNLDELSRSNLPTRGAAVVVNNAVIAAHMRIFRYVSWASNGVNDKLLRNLREEIEGDISSTSTTMPTRLLRLPTKCSRPRSVCSITPAACRPMWNDSCAT